MQRLELRRKCRRVNVKEVLQEGIGWGLKNGLIYVDVEGARVLQKWLQSETQKILRFSFSSREIISRQLVNKSIG